MAEVNKVAGSLTEREIRGSVRNILSTIKEDSLPQLKLQNEGVYIPLSQEEISISCAAVYEDLDY